MMLTDSIETNESYYMVEIRSIKRIMDAAEGKPAALCFVDEVLRGTNTVERIAASSQILKSLAERHVMAFAATHDIELTDMLADFFDNYHFEEEIVDGSIHFSYKLLNGKAQTRNAIRLLSIMGYDESVIENAENTAEHFMEEGTWPVLQR
jgi:DNA mismatch repair ATPase MutS